MQDLGEDVCISFGASEDKCVVVINLDKKTPFTAQQVIDSIEILKNKVLRDGEDIFVDSVEDKSGRHSLN